MIRLKGKAQRIMNKPKEKKEKPKRKNERTWISIPNFKNSETIAKAIEKTWVRVSTNTDTKIGDMIKRSPKATQDTTNTAPKSVVYQIPCGGCDSSYVGETGRGLDTRIKEHKGDFKFHRTSNAIVIHAEQHHHLPDWKNAKVLEKNIGKRTRKILEAAHISARNTFNTKKGFIALSSCTVRLLAELR